MQPTISLSAFREPWENIPERRVRRLKPSFSLFCWVLGVGAVFLGVSRNGGGFLLVCLERRSVLGVALVAAAVRFSFGERVEFHFIFVAEFCELYIVRLLRTVSLFCAPFLLLRIS